MFERECVNLAITGLGPYDRQLLQDMYISYSVGIFILLLPQKGHGSSSFLFTNANTVIYQSSNL